MKTTPELREWRKDYFRRKYERGECKNCKLPRLADQQVCVTCLEKRRNWQCAHKVRPDPVRLRAWKKLDQAKKRRLVIDHYGGICACCKESEIAFLTVDHINGDGHKDRRIRGNKNGVGHYRITGYNWYVRIIGLGFPDDLQVLCWNCNEAKRILGKCPHLKEAS